MFCMNFNRNYNRHCHGHCNLNRTCLIAPSVLSTWHCVYLHFQLPRLTWEPSLWKLLHVYLLFQLLRLTWEPSLWKLFMFIFTSSCCGSRENRACESCCDEHPARPEEHGRQRLQGHVWLARGSLPQRNGEVELCSGRVEILCTQQIYAIKGPFQCCISLEIWHPPCALTI